MTARPQPSEPRWTRAIMRGAAVRFGRLTLGSAGVTAIASLAIGLLSGNSLSRSLSTGFYLVGCCTLVVGFALAARGPLRIGSHEQRGLRWVTSDERDDAIADSALFVALGVLLLVLGVLSDTRYPLL